MIRLGVNVDHVATLRQARGELYPSPVLAAGLAILGGADNITCHLREDRRHIQDLDVELLKSTIDRPLNFEMAATEEMIKIALSLKPHSVTLVPERRQELTTEGGLDVISQKALLKPAIKRLKESHIQVALFIEALPEVVTGAHELGSDAVEFHTGSLCHKLDRSHNKLEKIAFLGPMQKAAEVANRLGLAVHLGHGINYHNASWMQRIPYAEEANVGHAIIAQAIFTGLTEAVREMKSLLNDPTLSQN